MARIYLIRHGRPASTWGDAADADPGLDEAGRTQAAAASAALMALPAEDRPRLVVSSPLRRCRETAAPFARALGLEARIEPLVGEIPTPAALTPAERGPWLRTAFAGRWADIEGDLDYEAWRAAATRAVAALPAAAIFSHFVAINAVVSSVEGDARVLAFQPDHASITVLEADGERLRLISRGREAETKVL